MLELICIAPTIIELVCIAYYVVTGNNILHGDGGGRWIALTFLSFMGILIGCIMLVHDIKDDK